MDIQEFIHGVEGLRSNLLKQARHYLNDADDAEDAVQETLVKLWVVRDRVAEASKMRNMAAVVCRNVSLNMLRDKRQTVSIDGGMGGGLARQSGDTAGGTGGTATAAT